ncbi:MAG: hypothetical protein QOG59_3666 [Solirubrobacteraceae bacterium]|nr:hypothetical protein [Solirubrobacteraceae bacterium]
MITTVIATPATTPRVVKRAGSRITVSSMPGSSGLVGPPLSITAAPKAACALKIPKATTYSRRSNRALTPETTVPTISE